MVGRGAANEWSGGGPLYLMLVGSRRLSTELGDMVESIDKTEPQPLVFDYTLDANGHPENVYCRSDHYEYARYGIPIVFFTTGLHQDYHQVTDEVQYIDFTHMARIRSPGVRRGDASRQSRPSGSRRQTEAGSARGLQAVITPGKSFGDRVESAARIDPIEGAERRPAAARCSRPWWLGCGCLVASLLLGSVARPQSRPPAPVPGPTLAGRPLVIFLPGREQDDRTSADVRREYYQALHQGAGSVGGRDGRNGSRHLRRRSTFRRLLGHLCQGCCGAHVSSARHGGRLGCSGGVGKARTHLSGLVNDIASVQKWVASAVPDESASPSVGGGTGGAGAGGVGPVVSRQAGNSVLLMATSTIQAQLGEATYIAGELDRTAVNLRTAGRASLADGVHAESSHLLRVRDALRELSVSITVVTGKAAAFDDTRSAPPDPTNRMRGAPDSAATR